jgi:hypothetical protein
METPGGTLGLVVHRGAVVLRAERVVAGVRRVVARPAGLEVHIRARRRSDPRSAQERQADIRAGRDAVRAAARRLLPAYDEGMALRLGWLTGPDRAQWGYPQREAGSGDDLDAVFAVPAGVRRLVLAWPEVGMPETVVPLDLPPAAEIAAAAVSIWQAPTGALPMPADLPSGPEPAVLVPPATDLGTVVAGPRVLHRAAGAAVVLEHLTVHRDGLELGVLSVAHGRVARAVTHAGQLRPETWELSYGGGARVAVVDGAASWLPLLAAESSSGGGGYESRADLVAPLPTGDSLTLLVSWPEAQLADALVRVPLPPGLAADAARSEPFWPT